MEELLIQGIGVASVVGYFAYQIRALTKQVANMSKEYYTKAEVDTMIDLKMAPANVTLTVIKNDIHDIKQRLTNGKS